MHVQKRLSEKGNWLEDLRPMLADGSMTSPDFDFSDFGKAGLDFCTAADGKQNAIPTFVDYWILYYNKELFEQKGVAYPKSMDEIFDGGAEADRPGKGVYGFVSRGLKNANVPVWTSWLLGQGAETVSKDGKLLTDTPEAIWAGELYKRLNREFAPPGTVGFNWNECQTSFAQGRAAMWLDGIGFATPLEDPTKSRIVGKVGYGVVPHGTEGAALGDLRRRPRRRRAARRKKGAAWFYVQYITNKRTSSTSCKNGAGSPARNSAFANQDVVRESKFGKQWFDCVLESAKVGRPGLPVIIPVTEFRDVFGVALTNMISGADPADRAEEGDRNLQAGAREERAGLTAKRMSVEHNAVPSRSPGRDGSARSAQAHAHARRIDRLRLRLLAQVLAVHRCRRPSSSPP